MIPAVESGQASDAGRATVAGQAFDAAPFAQARYDAATHAYAVQWAEPRKIRRIEVEFEANAVLPGADSVRLQYWCQSWDGRPDPIQVETGVAGAGWTAVDDWTNGRWKDADTRVDVGGNRWTYSFAPTGEKEFKDIGQPGVAYRKTLKVRLLAEKSLPKPHRFRAFTDAVCRPLGVRILWGKPAAAGLRVDGENAGRLEVYNGSVRAVRPLGDGRRDCRRRHALGVAGRHARRHRSRSAHGRRSERRALRPDGRYRPLPA